MACFLIFYFSHVWRFPQKVKLLPISVCNKSPNKFSSGVTCTQSDKLFSKQIEKDSGYSLPSSFVVNLLDIQNSSLCLLFSMLKPTNRITLSLFK